MTRLEQALDRICRDLSASGVRFALVGGLAVSARSEPRLTRDIDLAVAVMNDLEAEALIRRLGYEVLASVEQTAVGRLATVRLDLNAAGIAGVVVDLLFASSGIEREIASEAEVLEVVAGQGVPVARAGHLLALKILARDDAARPQDRGDIRSLLKEMEADEITRARIALELIHKRGFHRGRDLLAALDQAISENASS